MYTRVSARPADARNICRDPALSAIKAVVTTMQIFLLFPALFRVHTRGVKPAIPTCQRK